MKMSGYWVYIITTPDKMNYVGMSKAKYTCKRCRKDLYKTTALQPYIEEFGFESFSKFFIDGLKSKEEAARLENELIEMYSKNGSCINRKQSGLITKDEEHRKEYNSYRSKKSYYRNREKKLEYQRKYESEKRKKFLS